MKSNKKIIIGIVGEIASGKDTVADYLTKNYGSETVSFSKPLRDILDILYLPQNRENMVWLGYDLRERFGVTVLAKAVTRKVEEHPSSLVCLPNVRFDGDIEFLKQNKGFFLVHLDCDQKIRYNHLLKRHQNPDDATKSWEQFLEDAKLPTEITIREIAKKAKYRLENNGNFDHLFKQVDELMTKIKKDNS